MTIGPNIKRLRQNKGVTQEQLGDVLGISSQAVSKWENESALPDILILPKLAEYFGISIDELMGYKLNALTYKEQFVKFMLGNGILQTVSERSPRHGSTDVGRKIRRKGVFDHHGKGCYEFFDEMCI